MRGTYAPGEVNNAGAILDDSFTDYFVDTDGDGLANDLGQFYSCSRLYENFDDATASSL